jgi:hypothetical protein
MALQNVLDSRKGIKSFKVSGASTWLSFAKARDIPNTNGLVHGCRNNKVIFGMEVCGHDIVGMTSKDGDAVAGCAVPYADRLVVGGGNLEDC